MMTFLFAILNMFEHDHSAARGKMAVREQVDDTPDAKTSVAPLAGSVD